MSGAPIKTYSKHSEFDAILALMARCTDSDNARYEIVGGNPMVVRFTIKNTSQARSMRQSEEVVKNVNTTSPMADITAIESEMNAIDAESAAIAKSKNKANPLSPDSVYAFVVDYANKHTPKYRPREFPTIKTVADHFGVSMRKIEDDCEDFQGPGYLGIAEAIRGLGGIRDLPKKERLVEID